LLALSRDSAEGKEILELQRATRFVPTEAGNYKGIEAAARSAACCRRRPPVKLQLRSVARATLRRAPARRPRCSR